MTERELFSFFPVIFGGVLLLGAALFVIALALLRQRRRGQTYAIRRAAGERGGRLFIGSIALAGIGGLLAVGWLVYGIVFADRLRVVIDRGEDDLYGIIIPPSTLQALTWLALTPTATPTATASVTPTPTTTQTPTPSLTPTVTPVPPSATPTPTASVTLIPFFTNTPLPTDSPTPTTTRRPAPAPTRTARVDS